MAQPADQIISELDAALSTAADPVRAVKEKQYLRSQATHLGVSVPVLHRLAQSTARHVDRDTLLALSAELWDGQSPPVHERRFLAVDLLANRPEVLAPDDLPWLERLAREASTWAIIDVLAPRVVGPLAERYPDEATEVLDAWARDDDRWLRRSALLAHLDSLRRGRGNWPRFTRYADDLLEDPEFFVAKAIGWVLRDTARRRPDLVLAWAEPRMHRMSRTTAREVVKPYPAEVQERLLAIQHGSGPH